MTTEQNASIDTATPALATAPPATSPAAMNLALHIRRIANGRPTIDVAQFQFVGFDQIRERYGDAWPEKRDRVQTLSKHFISKRIRSDDLMIPAADGFLLVFSEQTGSDADTAAQRISAELNSFFKCSGPEDSDVGFEAQHLSMSLSDLGRAVAAVRRSAHEDRTGPAIIPAPRVSVQFQPVWDARREALNQQMLQPIDPRTKDWVPGYHYETGAETQRSFLEIDERMLKTSEDAMRELFASGRRTIMGVALHLSSLKNPGNLLRLQAAAGGFDPDLKRYRIVRVTGIDQGLSQFHLGDICRAARTIAPAVALGFGADDTNVIAALDLNPAAVGVVVSPAQAKEGLKLDQYRRIKALAAAAREKKVAVFVEGRLPVEAVLRLTADGVTFISSPLIWPMSAQPEAAQKWPMANFPHDGSETLGTGAA